MGRSLPTDELMTLELVSCERMVNIRVQCLVRFSCHSRFTRASFENIRIRLKNPRCS